MGQAEKVVFRQGMVRKKENEKQKEDCSFYYILGGHRQEDKSLRPASAKQQDLVSKKNK